MSDWTTGSLDSEAHAGMQYRTCKGCVLTGSIDQVCGHTLQPQTHQSGSVRLATPANQIPLRHVMTCSLGAYRAGDDSCSSAAQNPRQAQQGGSPAAWLLVPCTHWTGRCVPMVLRLHVLRLATCPSVSRSEAWALHGANLVRYASTAYPQTL